MTNAESIINIVRRIVEKGYVNPLYAHTQEIYQISKEIHAQDSKDQADQLRRYRSSEEDELFKQRIRITNPATSAPLEACYSYLSQVWRTDGVKTTITGAKDSLTKLNATFETFYGRQDLHEYIFNICERANTLDPNAWIVFERRTDTGGVGLVTGLTIYPIYFPSPSALDWKMDKKGNTEYVIFMTMRAVMVKDSPEMVRDIYVYSPEFYMHFAERYAGAVDDRDLTNYNAVAIKGDKNTSWVYIQAELFGVCPAVRLGAYPYKTRPEVCELFAQRAVPQLRDLMRDANYLSVMKTTHCFPDRAEYVKPCRHENEQGECCDNGWYGGIHDNAHQCRMCGGRGYVVNASEQTVKRLPWPEGASPEELIELSRLAHYYERPIDIVQTYIAETERITNATVRTVMNQEIFERPTGTATATEIKVNYDRIYNKLMPFAEQVANIFESAWNIGFSYLNDTTGNVEMKYPADMKMMSVSELLVLLAEAKASGAPVEIIDGINADLIAKQYRAMPDKAKDMHAMQAWKPWRDKDPAQIAAIIGGRAPEDFQRQLWEGFTDVIAYLQNTLEPGVFANTSRDGQRALIERAINEITKGRALVTAPAPIDLLQ